MENAKETIAELKIPRGPQLIQILCKIVQSEKFSEVVNL